MSTIIDYDPEGTAIRLPDGRVAHLWHHDCGTCTSLDVWTTDGAEHVFTVNGEHRETADNTRAPMGVFTMSAGSRHEMAGGADPEPVVPFGRATQSTVILLWKDGAK